MQLYIGISKTFEFRFYVSKKITTLNKTLEKEV